MKTAKKFLAILLSMFMLIGCISLTAFADPDDEWDCDANGHDFFDGECIYCGEPDYEPVSDSEMVVTLGLNVVETSGLDDHFVLCTFTSR